MTALAGSMQDAVETNLETTGSPEMDGLSPSYAKRRGPGQIPSEVRATGCQYPLCGLTITRPQSGQTSVMPVSTTKAAKSAIRHGRRTCILNSTKTARVSTRFVKKRNSNLWQSATVGAYTVNMPARPFLQLVQDDIDELENTANRYFARVID